MAYRQQPCPYRIIDDFGGAFAMGCVAGCVANFIRGMWRAPKSQKLKGGLRLLAKRAPNLGGSFALWGGIFSITDCTITYLRNAQGWENQIAAGFFTGGILAFRAGRRIAFRNAVFGGIILGAIQVVEQVITKYSKRRQVQYMIQMKQKQQIQQRKFYSKMRPDLFSSQGQILRVKM